MLFVCSRSRRRHRGVKLKTEAKVDREAPGAGGEVGGESHAMTGAEGAELEEKEGQTPP